MKICAAAVLPIVNKKGDMMCMSINIPIFGWEVGKILYPCAFLHLVWFDGLKFNNVQILDHLLKFCMVFSNWNLE